MSRELNSRLQGDFAESVAIQYYTSKGFVVSRPTNHSPYYDLIVDDGQSLIRVEVKSSNYKSPSGGFQVGLRTGGGNQSGNYEHKRIDQAKTDRVFIVTSDFCMYCYNSSDLQMRNAVTVNPDLPSFIGKMNFGEVVR